MAYKGYLEGMNEAGKKSGKWLNLILGLISGGASPLEETTGYMTPDEAAAAMAEQEGATNAILDQADAANAAGDWLGQDEALSKLPDRLDARKAKLAELQAATKKSPYAANKGADLWRALNGMPTAQGTNNLYRQNLTKMYGPYANDIEAMAQMNQYGINKARNEAMLKLQGNTGYYDPITKAMYAGPMDRQMTKYDQWGNPYTEKSTTLPGVLPSGRRPGYMPPTSIPTSAAEKQGQPEPEASAAAARGVGKLPGTDTINDVAAAGGLLQSQNARDILGNRVTEFKQGLLPGAVGSAAGALSQFGNTSGINPLLMGKTYNPEMMNILANATTRQYQSPLLNALNYAPSVTPPGTVLPFYYRLLQSLMPSGSNKPETTKGWHRKVEP